jgi:hypothetical protein
LLLAAHGAAACQADPSITPEGQAPAATPTAADDAATGTVLFTLDHNRMIAEVEFVRPDGSIRRASAWVDTGNQYLIVSEPLAQELGLEATGLEPGGHSVESASPAPPVRLGGLSLAVDGVRTRVHPGDRVRPGVPAEANLPASLLKHEHVIFDYLTQRLTVARPGTLEPEGVAIPCRVNPDTGLFMIAATIDGDTVPMGVDTGSAGTWISTDLTSEWGARHPDWPHATGAAGSTNFFGSQLEPTGILMRLPELRLGTLDVGDVATLGLAQSLFDWYSEKSAGAVSGWIGANVLRHFRLEVDFPGGMTYWEQGDAVYGEDLDIVGLTLRPEEDNSLTIVGVVMIDGRPVVEGVRPGDKLIRVGDLDVASATMGAVVEAMRGRPGDTRTLVIDRDGERITVDAEVLRLPHR